MTKKKFDWSKIPKEKKIHGVKLVVLTVIISMLFFGLNDTLYEETELTGTVVYKEKKYTIMEDENGDLYTVKGNLTNGTYNLVRSGDMIAYEEYDLYRNQVIPAISEVGFAFVMAHLYLTYRAWKGKRRDLKHPQKVKTDKPHIDPEQVVASTP